MTPKDANILIARRVDIITAMPEDNPETVERIVLLRETTQEAVEGPFTFFRDGGCWEVSAPVEEVADERLETAKGATAVAFVDGDPVAHGVVEVAENAQGEPDVGLTVDDPLYADPDEEPTGRVEV